MQARLHMVQGEIDPNPCLVSTYFHKCTRFFLKFTNGIFVVCRALTGTAETSFVFKNLMLYVNLNCSGTTNTVTFLDYQCIKKEKGTSLASRHVKQITLIHAKEQHPQIVHFGENMKI